MTPDRYRELEIAFAELHELDLAVRETRLGELRDRDRELHDEVVSLLAYAAARSPVDDSVVGRAIADHAADVVAAPDSTGALPRRIGAYAIRRRIAIGGMGVVFEAEQDNPRRRVALKCLRPGFGSRELVRRFAREVEVLGQLQHPGIAQILEAGVAPPTEPGGEEVPYFAMELVEGLPLDDYARKALLDRRGRLEIVARLCDAVQHAHGRGFIHRDLKPENVLVDNSGSIKVLDFGIARAARPDQDGRTGDTSVGQVLGTLAYMSPEQFLGRSDVVDIRTDVYALGVIAYELLAGRKPIDVGDLSLVEAARAVTEIEPARLGSLDANLRGDVEAIVGRAIEKDPARRYPSVAELAADIRRHLCDEPILARPPSALSQLGRFGRRHRALVGGALLALLALSVGLGLAAQQAVRAERARRAEVAARGQAEAAMREANLAVYRLSLEAAAAAIDQEDIALARHRLDEAPAALRGWEWRHLVSRLDQSRLAVDRPGVCGKDPLARESKAMVPVLADFAADGKSYTLTCAAHAGSAQSVFRVDTQSGASAEATLDLETRPARLPEGETWLANFLSFHPGEREVVVAIGDRAVGLKVRPCVVTDSRSWLNRAAADLSLGLLGHNLVSPSEATICDLRTGKVLVPRCHCMVAAFSDDRRWVFYRDDEHETAALVDVGRGRTVARGAQGVSGLRSPSFHPDGRSVVAGADDGMLHLFRVPDLALLRSVRAVPRGHVEWVSFSPDGRTIAVTGTDNVVRLWDGELGHQLASYVGHESIPVAGAFSPNSSALVTTDRAGTTRVWDLTGAASDKREAGAASGYVKCLDVSPDGSLLASGTWDGGVRLWQASSLAPRGVLAVGRGAEQFPVTVLFGACGETVIVGHRTLSVLEVQGGAVCARRDEPQHASWRCSIDPRRTRLACTGHSTLELLDATTLVRQGSMDGVEGPVEFNPDGTELAVIESGGFGSIRAIPSLAAVVALSLEPPAGETAPIVTSNVAWSPDGSRIAFGREDGRIEVVDARDGRRVGRLDGHTGWVFALAYSPDGTRLASGADDGIVRIWDARRLTDLVQLRGHTDYVARLAWSPDGERLYSGAGDRTIRVWGTR